MLKPKTNLLIFCLFAGTAVFGEEDVSECTRYDPQEIKATFFDPSFSSTLNFYLEAVSEFENAIQDLKDKFPKMAEKSNPIQAAQFFANFKEEIGICLRAHVRHWSKITETQLDILDKR
ncbi:uncharacterized protein LOC111711680 [Eurytemora carolleeae]|uniref:uncharacterized protein LOC111711680 n=1 Tax=Eurytemora carolleeae TaxID=1294199 RepID=UPI000C76F449|nr:uncharacterized protein LOC111711680 [Eurytemora carolleeae]|eukprot:XP_023341844.1 uncharacterized protein LOC111711680 [Eurytemora affinis]